MESSANVDHTDHAENAAAIALLGVCALPAANPNAPRTAHHASYIHEILGHAGVCYTPVAFEDIGEKLSGLRILLTVGEKAFDDPLKERLERWVREGGTWISIAGLCGMGDLLGAEYAPATFSLWGGSLRALGEGFLDARENAHPVLADLPLPLHYFSGIAVTATGASVAATVLDAHHRPTGQPALLTRTVGRGQCLLLTPDITGSVVRIQQGVAVTRDGVPAPDGTGPVSDGVLKSDDGQVLDWLLDREPIPAVPGLSVFLQPVADQWRGIVLRSLFYAASEQNLILPLLWFYPNDIPALGHISHDTDGNKPEHGWMLLETMRAAEARSTWCVIMPGYTPDIIRAIIADGHELATHFDSMTEGCPWGESYFDAQWRQLCEMFGPDHKPTTNKNHYLRWEGDTEFFDWCIKRGITLDQSKGASKTGEAGFNFGTCHPYRPIAPDGTLLPIHELPTPTQDLLVFAPAEIVPPLLESVKGQYGILHLLFHPAHIDKPGVADSLKDAVALGRENGLEWWTGREIVQWEAARRQSQWEFGSETASMTANAALNGATLLCLSPGGALVSVDGQTATETVERWGFRFQTVTRDLAAGETVRITVENN